MMIPPVVGTTSPTTGTDSPGDGFAEAIAAALGVTPIASPSELPTALDVPLEGAVDVVVPAPAPYTAMPDQIARLVNPVTTAEVQPTVPGPTAGRVETIVDEVAATSEQPPTVGDTVPNLIPGAPENVEDALEGEAPGTGVPDADIPAESEDHGPAAEVHLTAEATSIAGENRTVTPQAPVASAAVEPTTDSTAVTSTVPVDRPTGPASPAPLPPEGGQTESFPAEEPTDSTVGANEPNQTRPPEQTERTERIERTDRPTEPRAEPNGDTQITNSSATDRTGSSDRPTQVPASTLHRVESAIRQLENAPPPKTITITVDEHGLQRVTVSLHADGVKLSVPAGAQTDAQLITDLEQTLETRGFDLSGRDQQRGRHQRPDEADGFIPTAPASPQRPTADDGVRI